MRRARSYDNIAGAAVASSTGEVEIERVRLAARIKLAEIEASVKIATEIEKTKRFEAREMTRRAVLKRSVPGSYICEEEEPPEKKPAECNDNLVAYLGRLIVLIAKIIT